MLYGAVCCMLLHLRLMPSLLDSSLPPEATKTSPRPQEQSRNKGQYLYDVRTEGEEGGSGKADEVMEVA